LYPRPPSWRDLGAVDPREAFWVIKHGIKMTGMPAWGTGEKDEGSWEVVLFIRHVPQLTPAEEREMEALNPKGPEEKQEQLDEEQFLNEGQPGNQGPKLPNRPNH
jgi:hypothetical protein